MSGSYQYLPLSKSLVLKAKHGILGRESISELPGSLLSSEPLPLNQKLSGSLVMTFDHPSSQNFLKNPWGFRVKALKPIRNKRRVRKSTPEGLELRDMYCGINLSSGWQA